MISGFSNEKVSYNVRYLNFPSTLSEGKSSTKAPTLHVIKIRFNNVFKNEKVLFAFIAVALSFLSLITGYALYTAYNNVSAATMYNDSMYSENAFADNIMNKVSMAPGATPAAGGGSSSLNGGGSFNSGSNVLIADNSKNGTNDKSILNSKKVIVNIDDKVSVNPFLPALEVQQKSNYKNPNYILPPDSIYASSEVTKAMQTAISGILFDKYSPSAIININGSDYLVKKGDVINQYKILGIDADQVTIQIGNNVIKVKVGELIAQKIPVQNYNNVPNLNKRFGGSNGIDDILQKSKK